MNESGPSLSGPTFNTANPKGSNDFNTSDQGGCMHSFQHVFQCKDCSFMSTSKGELEEHVFMSGHKKRGILHGILLKLQEPFKPESTEGHRRTA